MAHKLYDLAVKTGQYTDQSGQQKGRYQNVGAVMQSDDGSKFLMIARWFNPAGVPDLSGRGGESILVSMFEPKDRQQQGGQQQAPAARQAQAPQAQSTQQFDDDIPF